MRTRIIKKLLGWVGLCLASLALALLVTACRSTPVPVEINPATDQATPTVVARLEETESPTSTVTPPPTPDTLPSTSTPDAGAQVAPNFYLPDLDGQTWTLSEFRDRPVMLFFWATW